MFSERTAFVLVALLTISADAQQPGGPLYRIQKEGQTHVATREQDGKRALLVTVQFTIQRSGDGSLATDVAKDEIVVEEDGQRVTELEIYQPRALDPLTAVLALDTSGSMNADNKLPEAKQAARLFLDTLQDRVSCGLILFDHRLLTIEPPTTERERICHAIDDARALGGTAYLDATAKAIEMLRAKSGRRAVLLMTDGVDLNSKATLPEVIRLANQARVPVYTLGVGDPGKGEPVTTMLVLDHSGSMAAPAENTSRIPKITALHRAACRFVDIMRPGAKTSLLPFGSTVELPGPFLANKEILKREIERLKPEGETALFDAILTAIETLEAGRPEGKRAVVALTDGIDNTSRHRVDEVIERARETKVPLYLLGVGRPGELDEAVMKQMASQTGGEYHHARNEEKLVEIFEDLSIQLHDDGFDHESLTRLAKETGGKFYHARKATDLRLYYRELAEELQTTYTVTFPSRRPTHDGTSRGIDISVVRNGTRISNVASSDYAVHGVIVARMEPGVYLGLLAVLGGLLAVPVGLRRLYKFYGGE